MKPSSETAETGTLTQWQLIRRRFSRHRMAVLSLQVLLVLYGVAALAEFFAPSSPQWRSLDHMYSPPQLPRLSLRRGLYVYPVRAVVDPVTFRRRYVEDRDWIVPLVPFGRGPPYRLWGLIRMRRRFLVAGVERPADGSPASADARQGTFLLLGGDRYGRDVLSRILYGARISLSVGLLGVAISFALGVTIGGISGYVGGRVDTGIQRAIEIINAFPRVPLWLALSAVLPPDWSPLRAYFGITVVLSLMGWTGLARVVRGKILSLREEDYVVAARLVGASNARILFRHLMPGLTGHIIVSLTLSVPRMVLGETSLSFLGLGLRPPVVSWGVMLQDCMNMQMVAGYPWLLSPLLFIGLTVLCFNFVGDGLRDAADPYR